MNANFDRRPMRSSISPIVLIMLGLLLAGIINNGWKSTHREAETSVTNNSPERASYELERRHHDHDELYAQPEEVQIFKLAREHSGQYQTALKLSDKEVKALESSDTSGTLGDRWGGNGFRTVTVDGKEFRFFVREVCGPFYGDSFHWEYLLMVSCLNDRSINLQSDHGTANCDAVSPEWHAKIMGALEK